MQLSLDIDIRHDAWTSLGDIEALVARAAHAAIEANKTELATGTELSVVLCHDAFIRTLNRDWRGKDKPTNVLSFPADPSARTVTLGDIVIAYETTVREAAADGKSLSDHLSHLVIHGVLHLLGYDHESEAEAETMERLEIKALMSLGITSPYEEVAPERAEP